MAHVMARAGFEIVEMFTNTWPPLAHNPWANDHQNLVCLARPSDGVSIPPGVDTARTQRNIRRSYARISTHGVGDMLKSAVRQFAPVLYNFMFAVVLERISPTLMIKIARALKFRRIPVPGTSSQPSGPESDEQPPR